MEIIVVDDGSQDRTAAVTQEWSREFPSLRLISNERNRGKSYSVRRGMLEARGRIALFTDADLSAPIDDPDKLLAAIAAGNDVAIGSRAIDRTLIFVRQGRLRELAGMIFNGFVRLFTGLPFHDTQCGFKAFVRERSQIVFEQQRIEGFGLILKFYFSRSVTAFMLSDAFGENRPSKLGLMKAAASRPSDPLRTSRTPKVRRRIPDA